MTTDDGVHSITPVRDDGDEVAFNEKDKDAGVIISELAIDPGLAPIKEADLSDDSREM